MSKYIDLHLHSYISDGSLSPTDIVKISKEKKLTCISLTDHDTMDGIEEAINASKEFSIKFIPGIEMSCVYNNKEIHILGYLFSLEKYYTQSHKIKAALDIFANERMQRNKQILTNLKEDGISIEFEELYEYSQNSKITRAHFASLLVKKSYAKDIKDAFSKYLFNGSKYCPAKTTTIDRVMDFFNTFGFISSLAHPYIYGLTDEELSTLIKSLKDKGLNALEAYHSTHTPYEISKLLSLANKNNLLVTGGSDFHGKNKPSLEIGTGYGGLRIPEILINEIEQYMALQLEV